jgi:hypothetical protein
MQFLLPNDYVQRKNRAANIEQKEMHKKRKHIRTPVEPDPMRDYSKQPEEQYDARRQWLKRANDTDGRTVENGGLIDADCEGPRKVIHRVY